MTRCLKQLGYGGRGRGSASVIGIVQLQAGKVLAFTAVDWSRMGLLFISHSSADNDAALAFGARLRARGFGALFLDFDPEQGIPTGRNWEEELYAQLRRADAVVFLASPDSVASKWCTVEVSLSRSVGKPVFPVVIQDTPRLPILADTQWIGCVWPGVMSGERPRRS